MKAELKQISKTLALLNSMVMSGEKHSNESLAMVTDSIDAIKKLEYASQQRDIRGELIKFMQDYSDEFELDFAPEYIEHHINEYLSARKDIKTATDEINPVCISCGLKNSENCNTCKILNDKIK